MKRILVPCDFSKPSRDAVKFAMDIAAEAGAEVHLLNVIELPVLHDTLLMPVLNFEASLLEELEEKTERELDKLGAVYKSTRVKVISELAFGVPVERILHYVEITKIDLIIMGSHGAHGLRAFTIGSNAEKIVRRSRVPVMIVKGAASGVVKHIVFPNNLLEIPQNEILVTQVKALQAFFKATLHILYVNTPLHFTADDITFARLQHFAEHFQLDNFTLNVFNHTDEEEGIRQFTEKVKGELIAIGTHGRKGIAHLVNGSIAEDIVNHSDKLIWTYPIKGNEE